MSQAQHNNNKFLFRTHLKCFHTSSTLTFFAVRLFFASLPPTYLFPFIHNTSEFLLDINTIIRFGFNIFSLFSVPSPPLPQPKASVDVFIKLRLRVHEIMIPERRVRWFFLRFLYFFVQLYFCVTLWNKYNEDIFFISFVCWVSDRLAIWKLS